MADKDSDSVPPVPPVPPAAAVPPVEAPPVVPVAPTDAAPATPPAPPAPNPYAQPAAAAPPAPGYSQPAPAYSQPGQAYTPAPAGPPQGLAITSMITGIAGILLSIAGFGFLPAVAAVITGHMAQKRQPYAKPFWVTGLITGYVGVGIHLIWAVFLIFVIIASVGTLGYLGS